MSDKAKNPDEGQESDETRTDNNIRSNPTLYILQKLQKYTNGDEDKKKSISAVMGEAKTQFGILEAEGAQYALLVILLCVGLFLAIIGVFAGIVVIAIALQRLVRRPISLLLRGEFTELFLSPIIFAEGLAAKSRLAPIRPVEIH